MFSSVALVQITLAVTIKPKDTSRHSEGQHKLLADRQTDVWTETWHTDVYAVPS